MPNANGFPRACGDEWFAGAVLDFGIKIRNFEYLIFPVALLFCTAIFSLSLTFATFVKNISAVFKWYR